VVATGCASYVLVNAVDYLRERSYLRFLSPLRALRKPVRPPHAAPAEVRGHSQRRRPPG